MTAMPHHTPSLFQIEPVPLRLTGLPVGLDSQDNHSPAQLEHQIRIMEAQDLSEIRRLLQGRPGIALLDHETDECLAAALKRNPGASSIAVNSEGAIIGCCFAGHNGYRASFHHVCVDPAFRGREIGRELLRPGYAYFVREGIYRVIVQVADSNSAQGFWTKEGFVLDTARGGRVVEMVKNLTPASHTGPQFDSWTT